MQIQKTALREIQVLKLLQPHEHIVNLIEVFRHDSRVYIVFEQLQRTLLEEIQGSRGLKELDAKKIIYQMMKACQHMHTKGVMHRDIKPENMLMSRNGVLKVCDMGFARYLSNTQPLSEYVSTRWYRAPEVLVSHAYDAGIDIWAVGCIFCELLTGKPLFAGKNEIDMMGLILEMFNGSEELPEDLRNTFNQNNMFGSKQLPFPRAEEFDYDKTLQARLEKCQASNAAVSFARECLRLDPKQRPSASELLKHDYFNNFREQFDDEI